MGVIGSYRFDNFGRLTQANYFGGGAVGMKSETYTHDRNSTLTQVNGLKYELDGNKVVRATGDGHNITLRYELSKDERKNHAVALGKPLVTIQLE